MKIRKATPEDLKRIDEIYVGGSMDECKYQFPNVSLKEIKRDLDKHQTSRKRGFRRYMKSKKHYWIVAEEDNEIIEFINTQLNYCKTVIFSVPSDYFSESQKIYGNERLMNLEKWKKIINRSSGSIMQVFGYWFQNKSHLILNSIIKNSQIKNAPYIGFVIQKNSTKPH